MSELRELYQQLIIDHGRSPRNFKQLPDATHIKEGYNPLCGDELTLYLREEGGVVQEVCFEGEGCAISIATTSLMTEALRGKTTSEAKALFEDFHQLMMGHEVDEERLGKLRVLAGVAEFPARIKCATLCWHTLLAALKKSDDPVSTE